MEFFFAVLFLLIYNLRPQDWFPGLAGTEFVRPIMALWLLTLVANRSRPSPLQGLLRTPHDWVMLAYLGYIVFWGGGTVLGILPLLTFYLFTVQSLNSWERLLTYLKYWTGALATISAIGVLSTVGIDPTHAQDNHFTQLGRLALGTYLHDNPNALGHSIVVVIPTAFILYFWKGGVSGRWLVFPLLATLTFYCAWLTQSKGSYLVGGALVVVAFILGKPRWLQVIAVAMAIVGGVSVLSFLPRMGDMSNLRGDEGVQGRLLAWELAKTAMDKNPNGVGWNQFIALIPWKEGNYFLIVPKATHSSYVHVGADLGRYGLFLYLACLWVALHTLLVFKTTNDTQERCRRVLLVFLTGYLISGWMINRQYHTEFFLLIAATAALHRLRKAEDSASETIPETGNSLSATPIEGHDDVAPDPKADPPTYKKQYWGSETPAFVPFVLSSPLLNKPFWNRLGLTDLAACLGFMWLTLQTWDYILKNL